MVPQNFLKLAEQFGTPLYVYNTERIKENLSVILKFLSYSKNKVYFAVMCNNQPEILRIIKDLGLGVQINSEYELDLVKKIGFDSKNISYTSTGISKELMKKLIEENVEINLDSLEEVEKFCSLTKNKSFGIRARIPKKIKVTSDDATNIFLDSHVGIEEKDFNKIIKIAQKINNKIVGVHGYFASNVLDAKLFIEFGNFLSKIAFKFPDLEYINFGSGFGVKYSERDKEFDFEKVLQHYGFICENLFKKFGRRIILKIEPGRAIIANTGTLIVKVTNIKRLNSKKSEISVNAGFAELARPRIYNSYHQIENLEKNKEIQKIYDIRGNTVLQNDFLGKDRILEEVKEGDYLLIKNVGAYGIVMASGFPGKKLPKQVIINQEEIK